MEDSGGEMRGRLGELERRISFVENCFLRAPLVIGGLSLVLGLLTPIVVDKDKGVFLVPSAFQALAESPDTAGAYSGENTLLGIGFLGTFIAILVTVVFLVAAWNGHLGRRWGIAGGTAGVLSAIGIAVTALLVFTSQTSETSAGLGVFLLLVGAVTALIVMFGMQRFWRREA